MDSVELARQVAAELHAHLVELGADPWSPYDFVIAEAKRRGIDVEPTAAGAAMLNGSRATFIAADDLILHENVGSLFEKAFLVAHEIGHVELGDDPDDEPAQTIDPARAAEPSPVGINRVVDYGRRQRREVQMDLFARELLFPRSVARDLHLAEGLCASEIAVKRRAIRGRGATAVRCLAIADGADQAAGGACGTAVESFASDGSGASRGGLPSRSRSRNW